MIQRALLVVIAVVALTALGTRGAVAENVPVESKRGCEPRLNEMAVARDLAAIDRFKRSWELGWSTDWRLQSVETQEIDHFMSGLVLTWVRVEGDRRVERTDAFTTDGCFYWAAETVYVADRMAARGGVYITRAGVPKYRTMVYVTGPPAPPSTDLKKLFDTSDILYYELEAFSDGRVVSVYRSKTNIGVDPVTLEPRNVGPDAELVSGTPWPAIERARPRARFGERHNHGSQPTVGAPSSRASCSTRTWRAACG